MTDPAIQAAPMSDLTRDRAQAILTLAERTWWPLLAAERQEARDAVLWLARTLLEALDTIDKAKALHEMTLGDHRVCAHRCGADWPCPTWQALDGGNE